MLENKRYNQGLSLNGKQNRPSVQTFLDQEFTTQAALRKLGAHDAVIPSEVAHVGTLLMYPELIPNLRSPYALEVLGMPRTGKTTMIKRYLTELWGRNERNLVAYVKEGADAIKDEYGDLRYSDPFTYSALAGSANFVEYLEALKHVNSGMRMMTSDRGQIDRRVFRRALFASGEIDPQVMENEEEFMNGLENTPVQMGGIIMLMARPEKVMERGKPGPVMNMTFLPKLYEQFWRLHGEIAEGKVPYRLYTCIDAEGDPEEIYSRFRFAADSTLSLMQTFQAAVAQAFPEEFDRILAILRKQPRKRHRSHAQSVLEEKLGGKVLIVGGDEMQSEDDILDNSTVSGFRLRK